MPKAWTTKRSRCASKLGEPFRGELGQTHGQRAQGILGEPPYGADPKLIGALNRASSLELFQLSAIIERMLADPRRILAVRTNMNLGQMVRFLDWRDGQMRNGKVVAVKDTQVVLHEARVEAALYSG